MGFFERFRRAGIALDFGHSVSDPSLLAFPAIDVERTQVNLGLIDVAKERGARNVPSGESQGMDDAEHRIVAEIDQKKGFAYNELSSRQRAYRDRIAGLGHRSEFEQLAMAVESAISEFAGKKQTATNDLYQMRKAVIENERDLNAFRRKHRLTRPSRRPVSAWWCWGVFAVIGLLETGINGVFLARGDEMGLVGGMGKALALAFINIFVGGSLGRFVLPNIVHRNWLRKILGVVGGLAVFVSMVGFNLFVAHYRAALGGDAPETAERDALTAFISSPIGIVEAEGWILFGLGLIFSVIAACDGWSFDDPYPGYGATSERHRVALVDYRDDMKQAIEDVDEILALAKEKIIACSQNIGARENQFHLLIDENSRMARLFEDHLGHLENVANTLLAIYRSENCKWRSEPAPAHFSTRWIITRPNMESPFQFSETTREAIAKTVADAPAEIKSCQEKLHLAYRDAIQEHERIDQLTEAKLSHVPV